MGAFLAAHPKGSIVEGPIRNITEFGLFIGLDGGVDGMVHLSDLDWNKPGDEAIKDYKKGDTVKAVVLDVDGTKERISLGIKQLGGDPLDTLGKYKKGEPGHLRGRRGPGERHRGQDRRQRPHHLHQALRSVARPLRAAARALQRRRQGRCRRHQRRQGGRRIAVSIKALEIAEEKQAVAQYGSSDSGASLGDIFKAAIKKHEGAEEKKDDEEDSERAESPTSREATAIAGGGGGDYSVCALDFGKASPELLCRRRSRKRCPTPPSSRCKP